MQTIRWINGQAGGTPLSAENLNLMQQYIENAIQSAMQDINDMKENLTPGVESKTNAFVGDKQVYVKRISFGALPNAGTKTVSTGLNADEITICKPLTGLAIGSDSGTHYVLTLPDASPNYVEGITRLTMNTTNSIYNVVITTGINRSNYIGYVDLYYTKNDE